MSDSHGSTSRRNFLQSSAIGAGIAWGAAASGSAEPSRRPAPRAQRLPREVWIATVSLDDTRAAHHREMTQILLNRMEAVAPFEPDVICLPETCVFANLQSKSPRIADVAETPPGKISEPFAEFARRHQCYVVCPIYTREGDRFYNAAVILDRKGAVLGEYRKMHPTRGEMDQGISPGSLEPPVFETDFGKIGAQICFDIEWADGWTKLREAGAEIVFWPSAFAGGKQVNARAWQNRYNIVSSTWKDTSKICDVAGEEVARTDRWHRTICGPLNLERAFLHTWPYVQRFSDILAKYGRKLRIHTYAEEEWSILESRSPDLRIADVLEEFELLTYDQHIAAADTRQCACRE